jgi:hypothetical protein
MKRLFIALALLTGGCVVPAPFHGPEPQGLMDEAVLESLAGSTRQAVIGQLGEPKHILRSSNNTYFLYEGRDYPGTTFIFDRYYRESWHV